MKKFILPIAVIAVLFAMAISVSPALADLRDASDSLDVLGAAAELPTGTLYDSIAGIINIVLGLIGVVLVVLVIYAGFLWMTARGDSKAVDTAKSILTNAIIGILITILAYGISRFVMDALLGLAA